MERPSRAAYAGPSFQKAIASVASAIDGAALNNPAKLFGRKTSASRAKVETANPPMKKRMTYSVTPRPPRGHAVKPASTFPDASGDRHSSKIVDYPRATAAAPTCSPSRSKVSTPSFVCIERMRRSPKASCILLRTALEHGTAGGTEVATVTRHARPDTANVRDVLLAEPHRVRFTGRALLRGPLLRGGGPIARPSSTADAAVIGRSFGWALRMSIIALHLEIMYFASSTASWRAPAGVPFRRLLDDFLQRFDCDHGTVLSVAFRPRAPVRAFACQNAS